MQCKHSKWNKLMSLSLVWCEWRMECGFVPIESFGIVHFGYINKKRTLQKLTITIKRDNWMWHCPKWYFQALFPGKFFCWLLQLYRSLRQHFFVCIFRASHFIWHVKRIPENLTTFNMPTFVRIQTAHTYNDSKKLNWLRKNGSNVDGDVIAGGVHTTRMIIKHEKTMMYRK